jgi:hypothetical protein
MILYVYYIHIHIHIITINIYILYTYIYVYLNNAHEIYQLRLRFRGEFIMVSIFWSQDAKTWFPYKMANLQNSRLAPRLPCFFRNNNIIKWYKMVNHTNRLDLKKKWKAVFVTFMFLIKWKAHYSCKKKLILGLNPSTCGLLWAPQPNCSPPILSPTATTTAHQLQRWTPFVSSNVGWGAGRCKRSDRFFENLFATKNNGAYIYSIKPLRLSFCTPLFKLCKPKLGRLVLSLGPPFTMTTPMLESILRAGLYVSTFLYAYYGCMLNSVPSSQYVS